MKIISPSNLEPAFTKAPEPLLVSVILPTETEKESKTPAPDFDLEKAPALPEAPANDDRFKAIHSALEEFKKNVLAEFQALLAKYEASRAAGEEQLRQHSEQIAKLTEEMFALRKAVTEFSVAKQTAPTAPKNTAADEQIAKLTQEMAALRKAVTEFSAAKRTEPPVENLPAAASAPVPDRPAQPAAKVSPPDHLLRRRDVLNALAPIDTVDPAPPKAEPKIAFLTKLWDYLNQAAFEIPRNKPDRTN